jgi:hypothetical protein
MITKLDPTDFSFVVKRCGSSSRPWRWEIYRAGKSDPLERSAVLFESMAQAAKKALADFLAKRSGATVAARGVSGFSGEWQNHSDQHCQRDQQN